MVGSSETPDPSTTEDEPYIPASQELPEFTLRAALLGVSLAMILGTANAYVGLKVGMTVSASIPAAVISMGILRSFKGSNVLENNIVQTMASAGESLAAGVIFTIPALIFVGVWSDIHLVETFLIALLGGLLGVLFTIPLRRALVVEEGLPFPEGVAAAQVLRAGEEGGEGVLTLVAGLALGGFYSFSQLGLRLWDDALEGARRVGDAVAYLGVNLAPILLAVGYIVGSRIATVVFLGSALAWFVLIPIFMTGIPGLWAGFGYPTGLDPLTAGYAIWNEHIRLVGGGAMITGGFHALWKARGSLGSALNQGFSGPTSSRRGDGGDERPRTERDMDLRKVVASAGLLMVPIFGLYWFFTGSPVTGFVAALLMGVAGFFFSTVAGYMAGVVGSSNNPISGVTIVTLIFASLLLLLMGASGPQGVLGALGVGAVIAAAGAIAGDNLQDLKTGHLMGATPWKQQAAQVVGVVSFALVAAPALLLLDQVFGIGSTLLPAPQAGLMAIILEGVFGIGGASLNWNLVFLGAAIGAALIPLGVPILAAAIGIYLPFLLTAPIFIGGWLRHLVASYTETHKEDDARAREETSEDVEDDVERTGILFASGLIAGEALTGILLAFVFLAEPTRTSRVVTGLIAPAFFGVLLATVAYLLGRNLLGRWRKPVALGLLGLGVAGSLALWVQGFTYTFEAGAAWPGTIVLTYIAGLLVVVPLRRFFVADDAS